MVCWLLCRLEQTVTGKAATLRLQLRLELKDGKILDKQRSYVDGRITLHQLQQQDALNAMAQLQLRLQPARPPVPGLQT